MKSLLWWSVTIAGLFVLVIVGVRTFGYRVSPEDFGGVLFSLIVTILTSFLAFKGFEQLIQVRQVARERIERIEVKAEKEPEKAKFAWELASAKLEAYFDRNLTQVLLIFVVAIFAMLVGFGFVLWGVTLAIRHPEQNTSWMAAISGIITEFIGVTVMVIYRSTMSQANAFMQVLERINTVGMAVQILDSIPDGDAELKNSTRAELVTLLLKGTAEAKPERVERLRVSEKIGTK